MFQDKNKIPKLAHGLDKVVSEESLLHPLRDLETQEFNFTPAIEQLRNIEVSGLLMPVALDLLS